MNRKDIYFTLVFVQVILRTTFNLLGSARLALGLILILFLLSLAGTIVPQSGIAETSIINNWRDSYPIVSAIGSRFGIFNIFHSWPFIIATLGLGINTLVCTTLYIKGQLNRPIMRQTNRIHMIGHIFLHFSIIIILAGGFISSALSLDGHIILTEGQYFREQHDNYFKITEGPMRREKHYNFLLKLREISIELSKSQYPVAISSRIEILNDGKPPMVELVRVNHPVRFKSFSFTQDKTGYSPHIRITDRNTGETLLDSFVALQVSGSKNKLLHQDFIRIPDRNKTLILTLRHAQVGVNNETNTIEEHPDGHTLAIEVHDETSGIKSTALFKAGGNLVIDNLIFEFVELRKWGAFRVRDDPGSIWILTGICLALTALIARYLHNMIGWWRE